MPSRSTSTTTPRRTFTSRNLDEHMRVLRHYVDRSLEDPETIQLARRLVSGRVERAAAPPSGRTRTVIDAWGMRFLAPHGSACPARDYTCEIVRVWDFLVLNMRYTFDPEGIETFATLRESLRAGAGDCDDATIAFGALLRALGFQVRARVISTSGKSWEHVYPLVGVPHERPEQWVPLDITIDGFRPGDEFTDAAAHRDFRI